MLAVKVLTQIANSKHRWC